MGQYIADDKTFDFIKYYDEYGLGRNSRDDKSDELKNTPGKIHSLSSSAYASIDTRYIADAKTVIFRISARVDENGNITNDNDADLSGYQVISTSELPYGSDGRKTSLLKLYDVSDANEIGAMTVVDNSSLPNGEGHFSENAVVKTCLPFFAYRDRLGTNNGSHEMLYRDSEGNTFFPVERSREIHNLTDVALYDSKENTVTKSSISAICEGDKLVMLQPQYNSVGQIVIYR